MNNIYDLWRALKKTEIEFLSRIKDFFCYSGKYFPCKEAIKKLKGKVKNRTTYLKFIKTRWWLLQASPWSMMGKTGRKRGLVCISDEKLVLRMSKITWNPISSRVDLESWHKTTLLKPFENRVFKQVWGKIPKLSKVNCHNLRVKESKSRKLDV